MDGLALGRNVHLCPKCGAEMVLRWEWIPQGAPINWMECPLCGYNPSNEIVAITNSTDGTGGYTWNADGTAGGQGAEERDAHYTQWDRQTDDCISRMSKSADRIIAQCDYLIEQERKVRRTVKITAVTALVFLCAIFAWALIRLL